MGALAAALGVSGLRPGYLTPSLVPGIRLRPQFLVCRSSGSRHRLRCSASATWPEERRTGMESGEMLAVGLGAVAVSVVVAVARPGAVPVGVLSLAFLAAAARHQLAALFGVFAAHVNAAQDAVAVHLSSVRSNVIVWGTGNGASAQSPTVSTRDVEPEAFEKRQEKGFSSAEIETALTDMAKSIAHLTMVVASLDSKITTLEKAASRPENNRMVIDATKPENEVYRVVNGNGAQLTWEEAVVKDQIVNEAKSQFLKGYKPSETSLPSDKVSSESRARGEQAESRKILNQSLKFSEAESEDTSMELFFQDAGVNEEAKLDVAAVEAIELSAGVTLPDVQLNENTVAQPQRMDSSSVPSGVLDGVVMNKGRVETSRSGDDELGGSESYRAVPTTDAKPDVLRLKRIMSGAESGGVAANSWMQNDAVGSGMTRSREQPVVVLATQSDAGWGDSSVSRSNGWADEDAGASGRGGAGRGATRSQDVRDEQGQSSRRRPRPEGSEEISSSGKAESGQRRRREGSSGASDADFGGNGSSSENNEGGNGSRRRQSPSRRSYDSDEDRDVESPTSQGRRPSPASPSYPSERTDSSFRNLPEPKSGKPDDERFQKILDEVEALLKEGREGLEGRIEVGVAERMLYEAAELCEKAVELRPSSLIAVGMWGNTLLLHGELKLRLSQNLRSMMPDPPSKSLNRREYKEVEEEILSYEATLQDVGEECEQLLVEAGRKYRLALSMDRTDMRALYNWGLALCYRGQLIAEEGGETAAQDADKVFLAAIDKFEAMMGLSDQYAAGALLNWGLAMRDRSRLRPLGSKERQRILAQAKEIFEEALRLDPNYGQARGAVTASTVELKRLQEYEEEPKDSQDPSPSRGVRDWWG